MKQSIHDDDETQQWSAAISSWTEDERLQASTAATPLWEGVWWWREQLLFSFSKNKEAGTARYEDRRNM